VAEWQTRTLEGRVGNRAGSSPVSRTIESIGQKTGGCFFLVIILAVWYNSFVVAKNVRTADGCYLPA
jgi:hypothetical protein